MVMHVDKSSDFEDNLKPFLTVVDRINIAFHEQMRSLDLDQEDIIMTAYHGTAVMVSGALMAEALHDLADAIRKESK